MILQIEFEFGVIGVDRLRIRFGTDDLCNEDFRSRFVRVNFLDFQIFGVFCSF